MLHSFSSRMFIISTYFWSVQFCVNFQFHSVTVWKCKGCDINLLVPVVPVEGWFVGHDMTSSGKCPMCNWKECVFCFRKKCSDYICWVSLVQCVKAGKQCFPVDFLHRRSVHCHKWVLKSPVTVLLSVSSCTFVVNWFLYLGTPMLAA